MHDVMSCAHDHRDGDRKTPLSDDALCHTLLYSVFGRWHLPNHSTMHIQDVLVGVALSAILWLVSLYLCNRRIDTTLAAEHCPPRTFEEADGPLVSHSNLPSRSSSAVTIRAPSAESSKAGTSTKHKK